MDSGCTDHMISNKQHLHIEIIMRNAGKVQLPTSDSASISHIGSVQLNKGEVISDVLCVPAFKFNLLSVSKLTKELNCYVSFFLTCCVF